MSIDQVQLHAFVSGRVQGVGFRYFVQELAQQANLTGWVRNLWDGRVEIIAEGDRLVLEKFLSRVGRGPLSAKVDAIDTEWYPAEGQFTGFHVRSSA
jgi:acylphosphatase